MRQKFSFHSAALPASSFTSVSTSFPLKRNLIYGSYLPKVSESFRKVADTIVKSSIHFGFKRGFGGGSGCFQINWVVNLTWPDFLYSWKRSIEKVFGLSLSTRLTKEMVLAVPNTSEEVKSLSSATMIRSFSNFTWPSIFSRRNVSSNLASRPASSLTSVLICRPSYSNWIYGSYLPKVSVSFKKVASVI